MTMTKLCLNFLWENTFLLPEKDNFVVTYHQKFY